VRAGLREARPVRRFEIRLRRGLLFDIIARIQEWSVLENRNIELESASVLRGNERI
jgi:hypothetical protein